jgi:Fe-S cluster biogenesis protein NfuA
MAEGAKQGNGFGIRVAEALARVRPAIQFDGGDIELVAVAGKNARVRLVGPCAG